MPIGQNVAVIVRHHRLRERAGVDLLSPDDEGDVHSLGRHRPEPSLELGTLG
jgi:hypothetical protein